MILKEYTANFTSAFLFDVLFSVANVIMCRNFSNMRIEIKYS